MTVGAFTWFDAAKIKVMNGGGPVQLQGDAIKAALCNSSQVLDATFTGASGDARYSDLTGELATANGYTVGGVAMTGVTLTGSGADVTWDGDPIAWTLSGSITAKYLVLYDDTTPNKDLLAVSNLSTGGGSVTYPTGDLVFDPDGAIEVLS